MKYRIETPVIEDINNAGEIIYVLPSSDEGLKTHLETLASYFKQEFSYDYLQYCKDDENSDCTGFLITERALDLVKDIHHHPYRIIGGGCFRVDKSGTFVLDWVWLHPFARNRNKFKKMWPKFKERFGSFIVTPPLSAHMKSFLEKYA